MKKVLKRIALVLAVFLILLVGALIAIPVLFKDRIVEIAKTEINRNLRAKVDFADVNISFFRGFPNLSLALEDYSVIGIEPFDGVPLATGKEAAFTIDIMSIIRGDGPVDIRSISLVEPVLNIQVLADGTANYDIAPAADSTAATTDTTATDLSGLEISLRRYRIENAQLVYNDRSLDVYVAAENFNHQGEGNFTLDIYDLDTETQIDALTLRYGGINYLNAARIALDAVLNINMTESKYTLQDNALTVNALHLAADGFVQLLEEDILMDLEFSTPDSDFRALWSLIPNAYTADYQSVDIQGQFQLAGLVKGTYGEDSYPAFRLQTQVDGGRVKYPDLPLAIDQIQAQLDVNSPSSDLDDMVISAPRLGLRVGSDPFSATFQVRTPISDPAVNATADGVIDLAQWARAFPVEGVDEMTGRIVADLKVNTRLSTIEREAYDEVDMSGALRVSDLNYQGTGLPKVVISDAAMEFTPQRVVVNEFVAQLGQSDLRASGSVDNILAYISPEKTMRGRLSVRSGYFNVDEWLPEEEASSSPAPADNGQGTAGAAEEETEIFDRFDFVLDARADRITYDVYELNNTNLSGRIRPNRLELDQAATQMGEGTFQASGVITNAFDYAFDEGVLGGNLNFSADYLDLNQFMEEEDGTSGGTATAGGETAAAESYGVIPVPPNIDLSMNLRADRVRYTDLTLDNLQGKVLIQNESVVLEDATTQALGGQLAFSGAYDTQNIEEPAYRFMFDLQQLDFQESFQFLNTMQSLAPIGQFIRGEFSSNLIMEGTLGQDLMPKLNTIDAEGLFETLDGSLRGYQPLMAIGNALNINELKEAVSLDDIKTWFTIKNGIVEITPFDVNIASLPMTIAGKHGLDQQMDYNIDTQVPRSLLGGGALGNTVNAGINSLLSQADNAGLNINNAEVINVRINLTGSMTDPKVTFKLLGADGETSLAEAAENTIREEIEEQKEQVRQEVQEEVDEVRDRVTEQANQAADSLRNAANAAVDRAKEQAANEIRNQAGEVIDSTKLEELLQGEGQEAVDSIKNRIRNFNPFRRGGGGG